MVDPRISPLIQLAESGMVPDVLVRLGIRAFVRQRLHDERNAGDEGYQDLLNELRGSDIALHVDKANEQHYEVPADFFALVLGRYMKYSSGYWAPATNDLDEAECAMLELYRQRADIGEHQRVLDLGCGWGSFTLWAAEQFPSSSFTAISNSFSQRQFIESRSEALGLKNVQVVTADINVVELDGAFDRIVSIEMFEHVRNYERLLAGISRGLAPQGKLFVHIFCHRYLMYPFEIEGGGNWMGRYFFTGGLMPAADTLLQFQTHLRVEENWRLSGNHYRKTAARWLQNLDDHKSRAMSTLADAYGENASARWFQRWRMFFMACEEMFGHRNGQEWMVCHYRFGHHEP